MRTPYGRTKYNHETGSMAEWGYAVAIQDTRGRFDSEGKAMAFLTDGWGKLQDGYDTVEWLAAQEFCNGRVGTVGASAMGITQQMMAPAAPPHLQCQYILVAPACHYDEACYPGSVFRKKQVEDWLRGHAHADALVQVLEHPALKDTAFECPCAYPRWDVNHHGGKAIELANSTRKARVTIHLGGEHASALELPVVPRAHWRSRPTAAMAVAMESQSGSG